MILFHVVAVSLRRLTKSHIDISDKEQTARHSLSSNVVSRKPFVLFAFSSATAGSLSLRSTLIDGGI